MSKQHLLNLSLLFSLCACAPIAISPTTSQPSPNQPTASPSASINPSPSISPSSSPSPLSEPIISPTAQPTATSTPIAQATADITPTPKAAYRGWITDDQGKELNDAQISVRSLNSSVIYEAQTQSQNGKYEFINAPAGVQLEITVSRAGYISQSKEIILRSNYESQFSDSPLVNRFDFTLTPDPDQSPQP